jgi:hypothetical protein
MVDQTAVEGEVAQIEEANEAAGDSAESGAEATSKEQIYTKIADYVQAKTQKRIGKTAAREIFDLVVGEVFAAAARDGSFRFNGGFGSIHKKEYQAGTRRLPSGQETTFGIRQKLRYEEGVVTAALVKNGGNLAEGLKARGSRAKTDGAPAAEAKPAKPAKGKGATPAAEPAPAASEGDLELD